MRSPSCGQHEDDRSSSGAGQDENHRDRSVDHRFHRRGHLIERRVARVRNE
jgi:hypothetical protein